MDELARRAGVTKPVIYDLFGSKEGLYRHCVDRSAEQLRDAVFEAARAETEVEAKLRAGCLAFLRFAVEHRVAWDVLFLAPDGRFADAGAGHPRPPGGARRRPARRGGRAGRRPRPSSTRSSRSSTAAARRWRAGPSSTPTRRSSTSPTSSSHSSPPDSGASRDPPPHRHRRLRLLRAGHGHPPQAGGRARLRGARARRRPRRHLARQHLPRLPLRRAVASLLVLVRAQPELVQHLLRPARDLGVPARLQRPLRRHPAHPLRARAARCRLGRGRAAVAARDLAGRADRRDPDRRPGAAVRPERPGAAGHRALPRHELPLRPVGPRPRARRRARRGDRHRRLGDPVRARDPAAGRQAARLPAHRALGDAAPQPAAVALRAHALPPLPAGAAGDARRHLLGARDVPGPVPPPQPRQARRAARAAAPAQRRQGPRAAREADADVRDRLQAHPARATSGIPRWRGRTSRS